MTGIKIAINGFGRIGRDYLRYVLDLDEIDVVGVNDLADATALARLLRYDSTYGPLHRDVAVEDGSIIVAGHSIRVTATADPAELPWAELGVDLVIEATGRFRSRAAAAGHLSAGAHNVIISAPGKGVDATIVMGVNDSSFDPSSHRIVSNASCTTNCAAPMVKVLLDAFGIEKGYLTTVHAYTNDQNVLDAPHKDPRRARTAATNIIPTSTGAARAVGEVLPGVRGRLDGIALRVPVMDGSLVDLTVLTDREVTVEKVNAAFAAAAADGPLAGRLQYTEDPIVSCDVIGNSASCLFDASLTQANGRLVKVFGWYDNEWGYTARLVDLTRLVAANLVSPVG
jgi:glyceraldehyde 3-phosphate dehydrogenase